MTEFFEVTDIKEVFEHIPRFERAGRETVPIEKGLGRILAEDFVSGVDLPEFGRAIMDGYALQAASSFGASEANPAYLEVVGTVPMGGAAGFALGPGQAAKISTGGMLPQGADAVVMVEHTSPLDETTIEIYKSVAPGQNAISAGEDFTKGETILIQGRKLRPQEIGVLAAFGQSQIQAFKRPRVGIISTGDEVVPITEPPGPGQIRDINSYTLAGFVQECGGEPVSFGIVRDNYETLLETCIHALEKSDMVLISGGSSVGMRDLTIDVLSALPKARILFHGIPISPGKPTILAEINAKPFWGLPGHVVSAMIVFSQIVRPFMDHIAGRHRGDRREKRLSARLSRNIASVQGRVDYVRVKLIEKPDGWWAEPILGKSALINSMVKADGLIAIDLNTEGLDQGSRVAVIPI